MAETFSDLIRRWPTVVAFAAEVGAPERSTREWLRMKSIPAPWFAAVIRAAQARGFDDITATHLADLAEARRLAKQKAAA